MRFGQKNLLMALYQLLIIPSSSAYGNSCGK